MKSFDTDLKKYAEKISLKVSERHELRERILSYMEYHPLPKQVLSKKELVTGIPSESFITLHFNSFYARIAGGILLLLLIIAPFVAEKSVPGDVLYVVKTGFNETIQGQLANSPYKKIEFETRLMERRIAEARELASEGKLTEEVKTQIAEDVKGHTDAVQSGLAELRTKDADGAAIAQIAFNSSLEVQSAVLGANDSTNSTSSIDSILTVVNEAHDVVATNQETEKPSFDGLMARVELETTRAYELFATVKLSATPEEISDIERRLSDIDRLILEAKEKNTKESEIAANDLATTLGLTQKLIAFMTDIDVRQAVELETLVPVVLSDEERITSVQAEIQAIGTLNKEIKQRLDAMNGDGMKEKINEGIARVEELTLKANTSLGIADIDVAEGAIHEARALVDDLDKMTQHADAEETPKIGDGQTTDGGTTTPDGGEGRNGSSTAQVSLVEHGNSGR